MQRQKYDELERKAKEDQVVVPKITDDLLRKKYGALKLKVDNLHYLESTVRKDKLIQEKRAMLDEKYDYTKKKVVKELEPGQQDK